MELLSLPADKTVLRRYVEDLWLPYHRELESTVDHHALADDVDLVDEEVAFRRDRLEDERYEAWIAVDTSDAEPESRPDLADTDGEFAGFVTTEITEAPTVFERPDRVRIGDIYVRDPYRGTGLARDLVDRAAERARTNGCAQLTLDVDVDNERAIGFYEKLGFEPMRRQLVIDVGELRS